MLNSRRWLIAEGSRRDAIPLLFNGTNHYQLVDEVWLAEVGHPACLRTVRQEQFTGFPAAAADASQERLGASRERQAAGGRVIWRREREILSKASLFIKKTTRF